MKQLDIFKAASGHLAAVFVVTKANIFINIRGHFQPCWWQHPAVVVEIKTSYFKLKLDLFPTLTNRVLCRLLAQRCHNMNIKVEAVQEKEMIQHIRDLH